jgi:hypothetical protein
MPYIFIDESGQFSKNNGGGYFIVGSFSVGNPRRTEKGFCSWQRSRFPRKFRHQPEIKFCDVKIEDNLRLKTLNHIAKLDVRINYSYLLKKNIPEEYWKKDKLQSGHLYANIIGEILEMYLPTTDKEFRVFCDERHLKNLTKSQFEELLKNRLAPKLLSGSIVQIEMIDSKKNANIQIADWISGALAWYLENKPLGKECFVTLKNNIICSKELFEGHWENKYKKSQS